MGGVVSVTTGRNPIRFPACSVNHIPPGPDAIPNGCEPVVGSGNSANTPAIEMAPIRSALFSVNHRRPSGPAAIPTGPPPVGSGYTEIVAMSGVIETIDWPVRSVNHTLPSGPVAIPESSPPGTTGTSAIRPVMVTRATLFTPCSVNHIAPSGPSVIP
ncbi:MAG: hypothetical protein HY240_00920 [Actinobacteria bacterium]|nr:hypothetical protein [Actinomycetota bacterium]